jgi:probable F420-dependent oxidoreductase
MSVKVSIQLVPQHGDMKRMREAWMEAEGLGVDRIYTADHFHTQVFTSEVIETGARVPTKTAPGKNFEAMTIQSAMAATTNRVEIGCIVHANSYRNPNLMADMARTIDHISGGRFVLGMGAGYLQPDYEAYGYDFGTAKTRMLALQRDIPIMKARFQKLTPPPTRHIPMMIAAMGENIGMRIVAAHADIWHIYGLPDKIAQKYETLKGLCREIGREPAEIEMSTNYAPNLGSYEGDPDTYLDLGAGEIVILAVGPDWDFGLLRETLAWRKRLST